MKITFDRQIKDVFWHPGQRDLNVLLDDDQPQPVPGIDIQIPLEMLDHGVDSRSDGDYTHLSSQIVLDPAHYDGQIEWTFETIAYNNSASEVYVALVNVTSGTAMTSCIIPPYSAPARRRTTQWFPDAGSQTYAIRIQQTPTNQDCVVYCARIICSQRGATRSRVQIPLIGAYNDSHGYQTAPVDSTVSREWGRGNADRYAMWTYDASRYDRVAGVELEAIGENVKLGLDGAGMPNLILSELEIASTPVRILDGDTISVEIASLDGKPAHLYAARLYLTLEDLTKCEVLWRLSRYQHSSFNALYFPMLYEADRYTNPVARLHAVACGNGPSVDLTQSGGRDDTGRWATYVSEVYPSVMDLYRSDPVEMDDSFRYSARIGNEDGQLSLTQACLAVGVGMIRLVLSVIIACMACGCIGNPHYYQCKASCERLAATGATSRVWCVEQCKHTPSGHSRQ